MASFWEQLKKEKGSEPIIVLAPMADVTDAAFRRIIAEFGKPDVTWTEFVSADGLIKATEIGKKKLMLDLVYTEAERPIVAQLFGSNEETMEQAAKLVKELGFDGLDINMGCPDRAIEKQGAGAAMIKDPAKARAIIRAAKRGAGTLPVSVKTRVGFNSVQLDTWLPELLAEQPEVVTIHARTRKEMSKVPARWEHVAEAVTIRNNFKNADGTPSQTLIFGNGDVKDLADAYAKAQATKADGVMIGRGIFGNPWRFNKTISIEHIPIKERLEVMVRHTKLFEELLGGVKSFAIMKKHFKAYVANFAGSAELRAKLMETTNAGEVEAMVKAYINTL